MKILHTSDWHFGKTAPVIGSYEKDQRHFLRQLERIIDEEEIGAVLCAGDVYDSAKVSGEAIRLYTEAATMICISRRMPFCVTAGNHDSADRLTSCDELLEKAGLYVRGRLADSLAPIMLDKGRVAVYALPFFHPGEVAAIWPEAGVRTMTEAVTAVVDYIKANWDPNCCNILMAHLAASGAELSESDRTAANSAGEDGHVIGGSSTVNPALFEGFDYVALGHIHKPQQLAEKVCYSGTPVKYSFGREEKQQKGVWIFDTEERSFTFRNLEDLHSRASVTCTYDEAMKLEGFADTYLRLTLTDRLVDMELFSRLAERFPLLMELYCMQPVNGGSSTSLSSEDVRALSERQILASYMKDLFDLPLEDDLADLFINALERSGKEDRQ